MKRIRVEGNPSTPRCTVCHETITDPALAEITDHPIARLRRDGSIIRETAQSIRLWCRACADKES